MSKEKASVASQRVADALAQRIFSGELAPGTRIKQDELAEKLNTSRIPVRDALRILEARGLVTMRANAGARVSSLSMRDLDISYEIRERIEPLLLAESIPNLSEGDIADLRRVLEELESGPSLDRAVELGREFHEISYRGHNTPLLAQMVERLWDVTQSYRRAYLDLATGSGSKAHDIEHWLILDAIERKEIETAQAALVLHIRRTRTRLLDSGYMAEDEAVAGGAAKKAAE